jgi:hypothetical protein
MNERALNISKKKAKATGRRAAKASKPRPAKNGGKPPSGPFLIIPYDPATLDNNRPIPAGAISWWCPAIHISTGGIPYTGGPLPRDKPTAISVTVANWGDKGVTAMLSLYWAEPTAGFIGAHLRIDGLSDPVQVYVPAGGSDTHGVAVSPDFQFQPNTTMPDHLCFLVEITAGDGYPSGTFDPLTDRHYAQHNVKLVPLLQGMIGTFAFQAGNPFNGKAEMTLRLLPTKVEHLRILEQLYLAKAVELPASAFSLQFVGKGDVGRQHRDLTFGLEGGETLLCQGLVSPEGLKPGQFSAGEVELIVNDSR